MLQHFLGRCPQFPQYHSIGALHAFSSVEHQPTYCVHGNDPYWKLLKGWKISEKFVDWTKGSSVVSIKKLGTALASAPLMHLWSISAKTEHIAIPFAACMSYWSGGHGKIWSPKISMCLLLEPPITLPKAQSWWELTDPSQGNRLSRFLKLCTLSTTCRMSTTPLLGCNSAVVLHIHKLSPWRRRLQVLWTQAEQ